MSFHYQFFFINLIGHLKLFAKKIHRQLVYNLMVKKYFSMDKDFYQNQEKVSNFAQHQNHMD